MENNKFLYWRQKGMDFFYGDQWGTVSNDTKNIPRAMFNLCKLHINNRQSNIVSVPVSFMYYTSSGVEDSNLMTKFVAYLLKEMKHDKYRRLAVKEADIKGTAVSHLYYDAYTLGTYGDYKGSLKEEIIDFKNVVVANPSNKDIQSQEWIIIKKVVPKRKIEKMLKGKSESIRKLNNECQTNDDGSVKQEGTDLVATFLKYYRINGEVYHSYSTRDIEIYKDRPLNPYLINIKVENKENDTEIVNIPGELVENDINSYNKIHFYRYPVHLLTLNDSDNSIYGISALKDAISTQKIINQTVSMQVLNLMVMAWDKYVVHPNALRNQVIDDTCGQVLVDYSNTGNGIKRLGGTNAMSNGAMQLAGNVFELFRTVTQTTDLYTGETANKDIAASALAQLNNQADKPIEILRRKLWDYEEEIAKTIELFIKLYFTKQTFTYEYSEGEMISNGENSKRVEDLEFDSDKYRNINYYIVIEAQQGIENSDIVMENLIQSLFVNGTWNKMTTHDKEFYIKMSPLAKPLKEQMIALMKKQEQDEISQLRNQNNELMQQVNALSMTLQRAKNYNEYLSNVNKSMQQSYMKEVKSHQDDNKVRDNAVQQILSEDSKTTQQNAQNMLFKQ